LEALPFLRSVVVLDAGADGLPLPLAIVVSFFVSAFWVFGFVTVGGVDGGEGDYE
jgi:membrane protein DedA with SNARE-associated domain